MNTGSSGKWRIAVCGLNCSECDIHSAGHGNEKMRDEILEWFEKERNACMGWIMTIGVLKSQRRSGIGTALMLCGMEFLKTKGMTDVELGVDDTNPTRAIELYKKVGFEITRKELTYAGKLD